MVDFLLPAFLQIMSNMLVASLCFMGCTVAFKQQGNVENAMRQCLKLSGQYKEYLLVEKFWLKIFYPPSSIKKDTQIFMLIK